MPPRLFPGDVELGKRDDDHKPGTKSSLDLAWRSRRMPHGPHRRTMKKVALGMLAIIALYYFFKNMPTDLKPPRPRPHYGEQYKPPTTRPHGSSPPSNAPKPDHAGVPEVPAHNFNGPIKFYQLASSLHAASRLRGADVINYNVLFAAASLKSAAILLPIACEMALQERNYVHFVLMGRDEIEMSMLKAVNGLEDGCKINFHDARPDFSAQSTDFRMEVSASAAFNHVNTFVHPQATFVDGSSVEEIWFLKGIKERAILLGRTVIDLPEGTEKDLMWITLLDSASLSAWNKVSIDIVIHAQTSASGSLIRLLKSLERADYFSSALPRLTVELPHNIDDASRAFLQGYKWPPPTPGLNSASLLTLHHRIPQHGLTAEENSIRLLESFWPADPSNSHVLLLSPQVELSPLYFHYLKYTILEYKHSTSSFNLNNNLLGISLSLPKTYLNDSTPFTSPSNTSSSSSTTPLTSTFLYQSPSSNAALYFGDKWVELHSFVSSILSLPHLPSPPTSPLLTKKEVSKTYPSWLEHILLLSRLRGYYTLYPNFLSSAEETLATIHTDLYLPPEEYASDIKSSQLPTPAEETGELTADIGDHQLSSSVSGGVKEESLIKIPLLKFLPNEGDLRKVSDMEVLNWEGVRMGNLSDLNTEAKAFTGVFRREVGGCKEEDKKDTGMRVLFCWGDDDDDAVSKEDEADEEVTVAKMKAYRKEE